MALPPIYKSRYGKRPPEGMPRVGGIVGIGKPKKDPFSFDWATQAGASERQRDPNWRAGTRDPYYSQRIPIPQPGPEDDWEFVMPDWKDSIYNQELDALARTESDAKARQRELQRSALIRLGSQSLAQKILGGSDPTLAGISDNPDTSFSTLAQIARQGRDLRANVNATRNDEGLFFSSTRANDLTRAAYEQQFASTKALQDVQDQMNEWSSDLQSQLRDITMQKIAAEAAARDRAIQLWILGGGQKKKKPSPAAPPPPAPTVPGVPPGVPWPTNPIYNVPPGMMYPI